MKRRHGKTSRRPSRRQGARKTRKAPKRVAPQLPDPAPMAVVTNGAQSAATSGATPRPQDPPSPIDTPAATLAAMVCTATNGMASTPGTPVEDWRAHLVTQQSGKAEGNIANAIVVLEHHPEFAGSLGFDLRRQKPVWLRKTPISEPGPCTDPHATRFCDWLQHHRIPVLRRDMWHALESVADGYQFDPVKSYLEGLPPWDGTLRLEGWLHRACGAEANVLSRAIGSKFLVGCVARAFRPGCRMDSMLILEGGQGIGKSTAVKIIAGEFGAEQLPNFHDKDAMLIAAQCWIIEVSELAALSRSASEHAKSFISRCTDTFRKPYGRGVTEAPRRCALIGTVNATGAGYLSDQSGNRRFLPIFCGAMDLEWLRGNRDQLLAEDVARVRDGEPWWVTPGTLEAKLVAVAQELREIDDPWDARIFAFIAKRETVKVIDVATAGLGMPEHQVDMRVSTRIGIALTRLKWTKARSSEPGRPWIYRRPPFDLEPTP